MVNHNAVNRVGQNSGPELDKPDVPPQAAQRHRTQMKLHPRRVDQEDSNLNCKSVELYR